MGNEDKLKSSGKLCYIFLLFSSFSSEFVIVVQQEIAYSDMSCTENYTSFPL